jgi:threonylcarbamoyladenosine tRNA methylthiotransferase MtaB
VSVDLVVDAIKRNVESGIKEVVLTGTHIGHFGKELTDRLTLDHLIKRILKETEIERLRLSSLHPNDISDELLGLMEEDRRLCPHIHISLQSPDTKILELMRRRYAWELVEDRLNKIAKLRVQEGPVFVGMDIIAGFSGETDADFESGVGRLRATPWTRLHVFPYSERRGTRALNLPGKVPVNERRRRAALLRALSMERQTETLQRWIDANPIISSVLVESEGKPVFTGTTPNYCRVIINDNSASIKRADVIKTRVTGLQSDTRAGEVALLAVPIES